MIRLYLVDFVLLNAHEKKTAVHFLKKLEDVNKLFLKKKLYSLKMEERRTVADHLNAFNMLVSQLNYVDVNIDDQECCMLVLCSLHDAWDHLILVVGSTTTTFKMEDVVASTLLFEEMRRKSSEMAKEALIPHGRSIEKGKKKDKKGKSKSLERSKSLGKRSKANYWNWGKSGHFRKDCKEQQKKKNKKTFDLDSDQSSQDDADSFVIALETHAFEDVWLTDSGASFQMTSHRGWFSKYEEYDGGKMYLGDDSHLKIIGRGRFKIQFLDGGVTGIVSIHQLFCLPRSLLSVINLSDVGV